MCCISLLLVVSLIVCLIVLIYFFGSLVARLVWFGWATCCLFVGLMHVDCVGRFIVLLGVLFCWGLVGFDCWFAVFMLFCLIWYVFGWVCFLGGCVAVGGLGWVCVCCGGYCGMFCCMVCL